MNKEKEGIKKTNKSIYILLIILGILVFLILLNFIIRGIFNKTNINNDANKVKKVLSDKYSFIDCVNEKCTYVYTKEKQLNKNIINIYNLNGKNIAKFTYNKKDKDYSVVDATKNYFITKEEYKDKDDTYSLRNNKGKLLYSTKYKLISLNDYVLLVKNEKSYTALNKDGKEIYDEISNYDIDDNNKYPSLTMNGKNIILNTNGELLLSNYTIEYRKYNDNKDLVYMIVRDEDDKYYYFDAKKGKKSNKAYENYTINSDKVYLNRKNKRYLLNDNGKVNKDYYKDSYELSKIFNKKINKKKYYLYSYGLKNEKQKYVFVDDLKDKSFGILNIKNKKYDKLYNYNSKRNYYYSVLINLDKNKNIIQINCSKFNCTRPTTHIYDLDNNKNIYTSDEELLSNFTMYSDGYKVIKYSSDVSDDNLKNKYVLYDKSNTLIDTSSTEIIPIDKKLVYGQTDNTYLSLYDTNKREFISGKNEVSKINIGGKTFYQYVDGNNKILINSSGKEVTKVGKDDYLEYSNSNIIYKQSNKVIIYNAKKDKKYTYNLKNNEKLVTNKTYNTKPFRGAFYVSNNKKFKIINSKGNIIRTIDYKISNIKYNNDDGIALIFITKNNKNGLYILK